MEAKDLKISGLKSVLIVMVLVLSCGLAACGKKKETKVYDFAAVDLVKEVYSKVSFTDTVSEVDNQTVVNQYELGDMELNDVCAYMSTAATTEEIAVFVCKDKSETDSVKEKCELRIQRQSGVYESYAPAEVERLKKSYLEVKGNVVILCISDDKEIVEKTVNEFLQNK